MTRESHPALQRRVGFLSFCPELEMRRARPRETAKKWERRTPFPGRVLWFTLRDQTTLSVVGERELVGLGSKSNAGAVLEPSKLASKSRLVNLLRKKDVSSFRLARNFSSGAPSIRRSVTPFGKRQNRHPHVAASFLGRGCFVSRG